LLKVDIALTAALAVLLSINIPFATNSAQFLEASFR
jgi:hypothetical protein